MTTWILLLRGINVGGRGRLPMAELAAALEALGCRNVKTYVQSGNAVFRRGRTDPAKLAPTIAGEIHRRCGVEPAALLLTRDELEDVVRQNPFPDAEQQPTSLHVFFLSAPPAAPDLERLERYRLPNERIVLRDRVLYLHAPDGIGRSKLAAGVEKALGVTTTARNWRSVSGILEIAR